MVIGNFGTRLGYPAALLAGFGCLASPLKMGIVCGNSMSPSFGNGKPYLMDQSYYQKHAVKRGDVVIFNREGTTYIKRVLATEGDKIYLVRTSDSDVYDLVMDFQLPQLKRVIKVPTWRNSVKLVERRVPKDCCFVVGDHLNCSVDSRTFGPILMTSIRGKVVDAPPPVPELEHVAGAYRPSDRS